jgi:hypothetical protein
MINRDIVTNKMVSIKDYLYLKYVHEFLEGQNA